MRKYALFIALSVFAVSIISCNKNKTDETYRNCCDDVIFVSGSLDTNLVFRNVITPNGDNINDELKIIKHNTYPLTFTVLDKDKNVVYLDSNYHNDFKGYDKNGNLLPDGKYTYKAENQKGTTTAFVCVITTAKSASELGTCLTAESNDPLLE